MDKLVDKLKELGFNTYESKVYISLLKKYPATGYEISKIANIPQARTYDTLKVLENKGIVNSSNNSRPIEYTPIQPKEITRKFKRKILSTLEYLDNNLPNIKEEYNEPVISISDIDNIRQKIIDTIRIAEHDIYLEIWSKDFIIFEEELLKAYDRNVEIRIVGYDNLKSNFGLIYEHPFSKNIENALNGRIIALTVDNSEGLVGKISNTKSTNILWSKNKEMVYLIKEFIIHDMYLLDIQSNLFDEIKYTYGKGLKRLHDKVLGTTNNIYNVSSK